MLAFGGWALSDVGIGAGGRPRQAEIVSSRGGIQGGAVPLGRRYSMALDAPLGRVLLALALTLLGTALATWLAGGLPWIGIDDAAITRSYAENIAHGHGYVYNVGGERVEGSTTMLWTLVLAVAYLVSDAPEGGILATTAVLAFLAVLAAAELTALIARRLAVPAGPALAAFALTMLALPGYFMWAVWTMMELALWSALLLWLVLRLAERVGTGDERPDWFVLALAVLLPLSRPEGIAVSLGLLLLAGLLGPAQRRSLLLAAVGSVAAFVGVTAFRQLYFGQPLPNTFYAKVSSDALQGLEDGLKYAVSFVLHMPFAEVMLILWLALAIWATLTCRRHLAVAGAVLLPAAAIFGMLATYAGLGGDHFVLWRFYQPVMPLLPVAAALALAALAARSPLHDRPGVLVRTAISGTGAAAVLAVGWMHYHQSRFDIVKEYDLVERGVAFGEALNDVSPRPTIGVGPAGGIALAYDGPILDLLGLNWTEMAHANPVKVGLRNHASFDAGVFWKHRPDLVAAFNRRCPEQGLEFWIPENDAFDGIVASTRFQQAYRPVALRDGGDCWPGFARGDWLAEVRDPRLQVFDWSDVRLLR
jgi:arabinofuranosyltransferase